MQYAMFFHNTIWILSFKILKVQNKTFFGDSVFSFFSEFDIYNGKIPPEFLYFRAHAYWVLLYLLTTISPYKCACIAEVDAMGWNSFWSSIISYFFKYTSFPDCLWNTKASEYKTGETLQCTQVVDKLLCMKNSDLIGFFYLKWMVLTQYNQKIL